MFDDCLYFNLSSLSRHVTEIWKEEFALIGLSPSHGYLLFAMVEKPGEQQKSYGSYLDLDASTVNRLVETLINKGFARKSGSGRGSSIFVTPDGEAHYERVKKSMGALKEKMNQSLGDTRFESLVRDLTSARETLNLSE